MLLREKDKETLLRIFSAVKIPFEVWAYGSRVKGSAHEGSDLDLVIRGKDLQAIPIDVLSGLWEEIKNSNIPILVELRDWAGLPGSFHIQIEKQHEVLFENRDLF